jgi:hypothetical protein
LAATGAATSLGFSLFELQPATTIMQKISETLFSRFMSKFPSTTSVLGGATCQGEATGEVELKLWTQVLLLKSLPNQK